ncbi:MAG: hypothetical protein MJE66_02920 [Proteobacteria bacterium]|nr:hypothetical protein [Pseudomonadota bacterium]
MENRFWDLQNLSTEEDFDSTLEVGRDKRIRNNLQVGLNYQFAPTLASELLGTFRIDEFDDEERFDQQVVSAMGRLNYFASPRLSVGVGASFTYQDFDETDDGLRSQPGSTTLFYQGIASLAYQITPQLQLSLQGGPTFIDADQQDPADEFPVPILASAQVVDFPTRIAFFQPDTGERLFLDTGPPYNDVFPGGSPVGFQQLTRVVTYENGNVPNGPDDSRTTFFGSASLRQRWKTAQAGLTYQRSESGASGLGTSTVLDTVTADVNWKVDEFWTLRVIGSWSKRESVSESLLPPVAVLGADTTGEGGITQARPQDPPGSTTLGALTTPVDGFTRIESVRERRSDRAIDIEQFVARAIVTRKVTRWANVGADFLYRDQDSTGDVGQTSTFERYRFFIRFEASLAPLRF